MKNNLTDEFVHAIERKIVTGEWNVGERLPTLRELSESMGVSRSVVNAGIAQLAKGGYIKIVPRQYIEVADWKKYGTLEVLNALLREGLLTGSSLDSVLSARRLLEIECVKLACQNASEDAISVLLQHIELEAREKTLEKRVENDLRFHHLISILSGNDVFPLMIQSFEEVPKRLVTLFYQQNSVFEIVVKIHMEIYSAIKEKNADKAVSAMEQLLLHGEMEIHHTL